MGRLNMSEEVSLTSGTSPTAGNSLYSVPSMVLFDVMSAISVAVSPWSRSSDANVAPEATRADTTVLSATSTTSRATASTETMASRVSQAEMRTAIEKKS